MIYKHKQQRVWKVEFSYSHKDELRTIFRKEFIIPGDVSWTMATGIATNMLSDHIGPAVDQTTGERAFYILGVHTTRLSWLDELKYNLSVP